MKIKFIILGCGSSFGVPRPDGNWGNFNPKEKKNLRTRCSALILKVKNSILIDTSPDIKHQLVSNNVKNLSSVIYTHEHAYTPTLEFETEFLNRSHKVYT